MAELYKKHRPKTLKAVIGNKSTVQALSNMIKQKTVPHTIMFHGPSGCGKTTLARILRNELACHDLDFKELNLSDFRGIDTIRDISRHMNLAPTGGPCRVWLLDEAHQMSRDAQNAALKILEDTPSHVYFLLCTTDPQKLLKTIQTRCCEMPVRSLTEKEMVRLLKKVTRREDFKLTEDVREELIDHAGGSARMALVLLDKIINLPEEERVDAIQRKAEEQKEAIELCRALIKNPNWGKVSKILKNLKGEPESIRWAVLGYARSVILGGKNEQAYLILRAFEDNFYDSKNAGLARACYEVVFGD